MKIFLKCAAVFVLIVGVAAAVACVVYSPGLVMKGLMVAVAVSCAASIVEVLAS